MGKFGTGGLSDSFTGRQHHFLDRCSAGEDSEQAITACYSGSVSMIGRNTSLRRHLNAQTVGVENSIAWGAAKFITIRDCRVHSQLHGASLLPLARR
jgi:hypothetical protein